MTLPVRVSKSKEYKSWCCAKSRCFCTTAINYKNYGGRGITMCPEWRDSFRAFVNYMGPRPNGSTLERKDVNGNYEPGNCVWATPKQQCNNRRTNHRLTVNGETLTIMQWSERTGISATRIYRRIELGISAELAVSQQTMVKRTHNLLRKLSNSDVEAIRLCRGLLTQPELATAFNVTAANICSIQRGRSRRAGSCTAEELEESAATLTHQAQKMLMSAGRLVGRHRLREMLGQMTTQVLEGVES
jgi:hypothetical protein